MTTYKKPCFGKFQSTHPVRGGTVDLCGFLAIIANFNPPTP